MWNYIKMDFARVSYAVQHLVRFKIPKVFLILYYVTAGLIALPFAPFVYVWYKWYMWNTKRWLEKNS